MNRPSLRSAGAKAAAEPGRPDTATRQAHDDERDGLLSVLSLEDLRAQQAARHPMRWMWWALLAVGLLVLAWMSVLAWPGAAPAALPTQPLTQTPAPALSSDAAAASTLPPLPPLQPTLAAPAAIVDMPAPAQPAASVPAATAVMAVSAATAVVAAAAKPRRSGEAQRRRAQRQAQLHKQAPRQQAQRQTAPTQADTGQAEAGGQEERAADAQLLAAVVQHIDRAPPRDFNETEGSGPAGLAHCKSLRGADAAQCRAQACAGRWGVDPACPMRRGAGSGGGSAPLSPSRGP